MTIRLFNTYSRELEEFHPLDSVGREVKLYTCGPTVYSHAHIGNFRAYLFEDLLQRHLELRDFTIRRVMNITDVDDKTINGSRTAGISYAVFCLKKKKMIAPRNPDPHYRNRYSTNHLSLVNLTTRHPAL